jgi:hypothetical protein
MYRSLITGVSPEYLRCGLVSIGEALLRVSAAFTPGVMGGAIAAVSPMGSTNALTWTLSGTGAVAGGFGVVCVSITTSAPAD